MDSQFIGSVINALPLENMISGPLQTIINAQVQASKAYTDFLLSVCIQNNKAVAIQFDYDETLIDESGVAKGVVTKTMRIPLIAAITHPIISIEEGTIDFELEVTQSESLSNDVEEDGNLAASLGWGAFKVKMAGRVSHKSMQTRSTDTRAKYSIRTCSLKYDGYNNTIDTFGGLFIVRNDRGMVTGEITTLIVPVT